MRRTARPDHVPTDDRRSASDGRSGPDGLLVVDKPGGVTSHDVVAQVRRLARTRKVGHAGTLDPMATGVLVLGLGRATRLLGHLAAREKTYVATARLGVTTVTDDAEGDIVSQASAAHLDAAAIRGAALGFVGTIEQIPSAVSAVKVDGRHAYSRVRAGEEFELAPRTVTVSELRIDDIRHTGDVVDVDLVVTCSSGTYIRAIARDLGAALGVGGHLTALRRTSVGSFNLDGAVVLPDRSVSADQADLVSRIVPLDIAVAAAFPRIDVDAETAVRIGHTGRAPLPAEVSAAGELGPFGVFGPDGLVALMEPTVDDRLRSLVVFVPAAT